MNASNHPRHSQRPPRKQRKKDPKWVALRSIAIIAAAGLLILGAYTLGRRLETKGAQTGVRGDLDSQTQREAPITYQGQPYLPKRDLTTLLFMGIDTSQTQEQAGSPFRNGGQADFLLLLVLDPQDQTVTPIQIERDTLAEITILGVFGNDAGTRTAQICLSHGFGDGKEQSCRFTVQAVSKLLLGAPIDFYISMNMDGIPVLNDQLGGITVTLADDFSRMDPAMVPGATLTLRGKQAEYFVRSRTDIGEGTNESRMVRQRMFLDEAQKKLDGQIRANVNFVGDLFDALSPYMVTDMKRGRLINEAWGSREYVRQPIVHPAGEYGVGDTGFVEFYADEKALEDLVIRTFYRRAEE